MSISHNNQIGSWFGCIIAACTLFFPNAVPAIGADDFLPPVQASTPADEAKLGTLSAGATVREEAGASGQLAISSDNAQDAINASTQKIKSQNNWEEVGGGCREVKFPSGFGFVSSGTGTYNVMPNPTATLVNQRNAYQIAYMNAKKNLAAYLNGLSTSAKEKLLEEAKIIVGGTNTLANAGSTATENISELVKGLLKGYVVYSLDDSQNGEKGIGTVTVTIVSTPKTLAKTNRVDPNSLTSENVKSGLNNVLAELSNGLLAPVGGKVISVPQTGELAFIGFGSAVVPDNPDPGVHAKLALTAQKISQMRARSALCGIILGDEIEGISSMESSTQAISKQFDELQKDDPTVASDNKNEIVQLENQVKEFVNTTFSHEQISSMRSGVLPPGVNMKTFVNPEKTIVQAVAVYIPSVSARATEGNQNMQNAQMLNVGTKDTGGTSDASAGAMPPKGISGQVMNDADL